MELELVDEIMSLEDAVGAAEVIVLAIPVDKVLSLLPAIMDKIDQQVVIDLGSTKRQSIELVKIIPRGEDMWPHTPCGEQNTAGPRQLFGVHLKTRRLLFATQRKAMLMPWIG